MASGALDPDQLIHALAATTLNDNVARKSAEAVLKEVRGCPASTSNAVAALAGRSAQFCSR